MGMITAFNHTSSVIFPNGGQFYYRVRAKNGVGYGVFSDVYQVQLDTTPPMMYPP